MTVGESFLGIDVGTGSVRAALFDLQGRKRGRGSRAIGIWHPRDGYAEQSSEDIWQAAAGATHDALREARVDREQVAGIGFDATCSLVVLGEDDRPVTVSLDGDPERNVVVWMDHRAVEEAAEINETRHEVLDYVGGVISPEMQVPKLLWLKRNIPETWGAATRFLDLADFLTYRATGVDSRSMCTAVCKWTYIGHVTSEDSDAPGMWVPEFFDRVGLGDLVDEDFARIGRRIVPLGTRAGELTARAAEELGLVPGIPVATGVIDAHAGGIGLLGSPSDDQTDSIEQRLALVCGTSSCHMAVSAEPRFVGGVWGPYYSAMLPDMWLNEGGQSATGALIDYVIEAHPASPELHAEADRRGITPYEVLNERLAVLEEGRLVAASLTEGIHIFPDFHGNRSPRADPSLRGMISGLSLSRDLDALAVLYLATVQAIAYGTRHILAALADAGQRVTTLLVTGGDAKNPVFLREHADATGCRLLLPKEPDSVLLGSAVLGAVSAGAFKTVTGAMEAMSSVIGAIEPAGGTTRSYHDKKYLVYHRMFDDQMRYRDLMEGSRPG